MAKKNVREKIYTHEGATAKHTNPELQLRRSVLACLLWEKEFYEDGESIANRIAQLVPHVEPMKVAKLAIEARSKMHIRHAPLWLAREMARSPKHRKLVDYVLEQIIQRADELAEFLALYWLDGKQPLAAKVKKGLAAAFRKFDEYQLAKYDRPGAVRLRDVLFLTHAKPKDAEQAAIWKRLVDGNLRVPDTWEVALSGGADKKEAFGRLMAEGKLGGLAFLRNLRNMLDAGVGTTALRAYMSKANFERVLPFRFIAAARYAPRLEPELEAGMLKALSASEKRLSGETILLVDVSGSMTSPLSHRSEMNRMDVACGLAILVREIAESARVFTFSNRTVEVPPRRGFALRDAMVTSQDAGGTHLGGAIIDTEVIPRDRLIVITDEQSHDRVPDPSVNNAYMINVASAQNGVGYGAWKHIDGFSESVLDWIYEYEANGEIERK